ncbi:MAG: 3-isopropylmalate dehydratase small subunit [Proteobacteria bacterium]|nr:3-isopropylmalate dehydratase small subunit [Pseudomonadota bacterium]
MKLTGKAFTFGNDIDTDVIIPAIYLNTSDPEELAQHCMEGVDQHFPTRVKQGDLIVAGKNFGCGSSREHAPVAIRAAGVSCVIARSFARIFYRNAFNIGLPIVEAPEAVDGIHDGDAIEVDITGGTIKNLTKGAVFTFKPIPSFMQELLAQGGLINYIMKKKGNRR